MKKVVLKLDILDERIKQKAMKNVSSLPGVDSISMDMKDKKLTVTGDIDPVTVVSKLRKICHTEIVSVGPAKEPEKKKEDDKKKDDDKKKEEDKKKMEAAKKKEEEALKLAYAAYYQQQQQQQQQLLQQYPYYNNNYSQQQQPQQGYNYQYNHPPTPYYSKVVQDETPNCVIS